MSVADIAAISVLISGAASPTRQGFGTPNLACYFNPATHWQGSGDRIRFYPSATAIATMTVPSASGGDGFDPTGPHVRLVEAMVSNNPCPPLIAISRRALPPTQILKVQFLSVTAGDKYALTTIGSHGLVTTHTLASTGVPATDAPAFAALMTELLIGTVTVSTGTMTITQIPGSLTDLLNWTPNLAIANPTVDPGITADLVAIQAANSIGWYGLSLDSNSDQEVEAAAAWVESTGQGGKWGFFDSADTANCNVSESPVTVNGALQSLTRVKSYLQQSNREVLSGAGSSMAALILAMDPGSYSLAFKSPAGVIADNDQSMTETQQLILNSASTSTPGTGGKGGNWYKTVSGLNMTYPGVTPGGRWVDQGIFADWLQNNMTADVFAVFMSLPRIPITDIGIGLVGAAIKSRLKIGASDPYNGIDSTRPIVVNLPLASQMSTADRNNRNLSGITGSFFFTGALIATEIVITGSP